MARNEPWWKASFEVVVRPTRKDPNGSAGLAHLIRQAALKAVKENRAEKRVQVQRVEKWISG